MNDRYPAVFEHSGRTRHRAVGANDVLQSIPFRFSPSSSHQLSRCASPRLALPRLAFCSVLARVQ